MTDLIKSNLGPILLGVIVAFPLVQMVASLLLRGTRRRFLSAVDEVLNSGPLDPADKAWLRDEIDTSSGTHLLIASFFAPFAIFGAVALGIADGFRIKRKPELAAKNLAARIDDLGTELEQARLRLDDANARSILLTTGVDPRKGALWNDPRRKEIAELSFTVETWSHPIAVLWIFFWLIVATPFVLIGYAVSGTIAPFLSNLWEPLRTLFAGTLRPLEHRL